MKTDKNKIPLLVKTDEVHTMQGKGSLNEKVKFKVLQDKVSEILKNHNKNVKKYN